MKPSLVITAIVLAVLCLAAPAAANDVTFNFLDGIDGVVISTSALYTEVAGLKTPNAAYINLVAENSQIRVSINGTTTSLSGFYGVLSANPGDTITVSYTYSGPNNYNYYQNVTYQLTVPPSGVVSVSLPRNLNGSVASYLYYNENGAGISSLLVSVYDSYFNSVGEVSTYPGGQMVYGSDSLATVYLRVNTTGYPDHTKATPIPGTGTILLRSTRDIEISVIDGRSNNAILSFTTYLGASQTMMSTDNGTVTYEGVEDGVHTVVVSASGYYQVSKSINVSATNTSFILTLTPSDTQVYDSPHYVRIYYSDIFGNQISGLNVTVFNSGEVLYVGETGIDGSVTFQMSKTIKYTINATAPNGSVLHTLVIWPQSSEYVVIIGRPSSEPSEVLSNIQYKTSVAEINSTASRITLYLRNDDQSDSVTYRTVLSTQNTTLNTSVGTLSAGNTQNISWTVPPIDETYVVQMTFTDPSGVAHSTSATVRTDYNELKALFRIPGFTKQWHYDSLCVFIVVVTGFLFSQQTKHVGGLLIPLEFAALTLIGWLSFDAFAAALVIATAIMALMYFVDKMERE